MADREFLLLSATEPDRSGLVAELTGFIADCQCNVEDSRVVVLGGYAGIMILVSGTPTGLRAVLDGLEQLQARSGIRAVPRRVAARQPQPGASATPIEVEASAIDHEGIVHALTEAVRRHGGNILELESATESAPMSGEPLFRLRMSVWTPEGTAGEARLRRELESVARQENVELELRAVERGPGAVALGPERRNRPRP